MIFLDSAALPLHNSLPEKFSCLAWRLLTFGKRQGDRSRRHRPLLQQDGRGRQEDGRRQRRLLHRRGVGRHSRRMRATHVALTPRSAESAPPRPSSAPIISAGGHCCTKMSINRRTKHWGGGNGENKRAVKLCLPFLSHVVATRNFAGVLPVRSDAHAKLVFPPPFFSLPPPCSLRLGRRRRCRCRTRARARCLPPLLLPPSGSVFNISPACAQFSPHSASLALAVAGASRVPI